MSDYYRDRCRHGGILSNNFIGFWWNRQVVVNQYGRPSRSTQKFPPDGPGARGQEDTIEGDLSEVSLIANRQDQIKDNETNKFLDDHYYASKEFNLEDIEVPLLSIANWGGILLHLRGNVEGYKYASSKHKFLRFITGRHDLPFYYHDEVKMQESFLDAFLKGQDKYGWTTPGKVAPITITLRKGDVGFNDAKAEQAFAKREEQEWPIARTQYTKFYLTPNQGLSIYPGKISTTKISYKALGSLKNPQALHFTTNPFEAETEITGHVVAHLNVSVDPDSSIVTENPDIDLFVTLRHFDRTGKEIYYTGTAGDAIPLTKGWLRVSLRKIEVSNPKNKPYQPYRNYTSKDVQEVTAGTVYGVDIEIWPTNVVVEKGGSIELEVASGDTQGSGVFQHMSQQDR